MAHLVTSEHHDIDIFIFSDSQAALRALDSYRTNSKTISECRKSLNEMATHLRINVIWVPGHRNIEGNCIADPWLPASSTSGRDCTHFPTTVGTQSQHATISRLTWPNYNSKRTKTLLQCSREDIFTLLNALTGHCLIGTHAHMQPQLQTDRRRGEHQPPPVLLPSAWPKALSNPWKLHTFEPCGRSRRKHSKTLMLPKKNKILRESK